MHSIKKIKGFGAFEMNLVFPVVSSSRAGVKYRSYADSSSLNISTNGSNSSPLTRYLANLTVM